MLWVWLASLLVLVLAAAPVGVMRTKRAIREQLLREQSKKQGSEATKALDDHLKGEW